jgi:hypothetical protein
VDFFDDGPGVSVSALLPAIALAALLAWLNEALKNRAVVAPPLPAPPSAPPKAPAPPVGVAAKVEAELAMLRQQIAAYSYGDLGPILAPASARILEMVKDYEARMAAHHDKLKGMIEK